MLDIKQNITPLCIEQLGEFQVEMFSCTMQRTDAFVSRSSRKTSVLLVWHDEFGVGVQVARYVGD